MPLLMSSKVCDTSDPVDVVIGAHDYKKESCHPGAIPSADMVPHAPGPRAYFFEENSLVEFSSVF